MGDYGITNMNSKEVSMLIFGLGWTSTFLVPLLQKAKIEHAGTTTTGRDGSYKFKFNYDPAREGLPTDNDDLEQYRVLPTAEALLITFPIRGKAAMEYFMKCYRETHERERYRVILLGSTGIWSIEGQDKWVTRHSKYDVKDGRAEAEDWLMGKGGCALDLSGLWGGERQVWHWVDRVAASKEQLKSKKSLHMIHGEDVARAIVAVHQKWSAAKGQRWMLTDLNVYDWWQLILGFGGEIDSQKGNDERAKTQLKWVGELMEEENVKALPRSMDQLGRCYDTREFWTTFGLMPTRARLSDVKL
ncbi:uncharacterized protein LY89DRAFT_677839 [Mollisia scopiformis]|uniref:Uncharacterized protein n=1 Tax=Mollisia scopiformis TaxID=149040 RepID=A0A132B5E7_MOLSC|nr:uncharacterized protein LY89DRAFT_677839 [Mollisia scopiformis]KUJ07630.1 hypothetical protein LY89DRAFT_677839 [Mollisia scopiformis]